jgi:N-acetylglutamate synthase-like GNAT family acetyltransferase
MKPTGTRGGSPVAVRSLASGDQNWAMELLTMHFASACMVSRGTLHDTRVLPALLAERDGLPVGLLVHAVAGADCEVVALVATQAREGIGRRLVETLTHQARQMGWQRLWAVTTNDNLPAIGFYNAVGWRLVGVHQGAVNLARQLKPQIPLVGRNGVRIEDELEFELRLTNGDRSSAQTD